MAAKNSCLQLLQSTSGTLPALCNSSKEQITIKWLEVALYDGYLTIWCSGCQIIVQGPRILILSYIMQDQLGKSCPTMHR